MNVYACICISLSAESSARFLAERSASETASARACVEEQLCIKHRDIYRYVYVCVFMYMYVYVYLCRWRTR